MKALVVTYWRWAVMLLSGVAVFLFWFRCYPHALNYQEQYQLFLWTGDYFYERVSVAGGLADWLGEFLTQFYYIPWIGSLLLAVMFVVLQLLVWRTSRLLVSRNAAEVSGSVSVSYLPAETFWLSYVPSVMLLHLFGDPCVLHSYLMALCLCLLANLLVPKAEKCWLNVTADLLLVPLMFWLVGSLSWLYVGLRLLKTGLRHSWTLLWMGLVQWLVYTFLLKQWPAEMVFCPMTYYRIPLQMPASFWQIPLVILLLAALSRWLPRAVMLRKWYVQACLFLLLAAGTWQYVPTGYDSDLYELICQDYLVRNERWDDVIERARQRQVRTPFSSVCVNLALSQKRLLADRMFEFYQSGEDALVMPRIRDLTSMLPTAETFYHLGLVNSAMRYMFDTQESILNGKKSGRCSKRIAECCIINGKYKVAKKYLNLLSHSLYYSSWAIEAAKYLPAELENVEDQIDKETEAKINAHPQWGRLRRLRFKDDFLYSYAEIDKMFGLLFDNNHENQMALDYFMAQLLLKGDLQSFMQYMPWVQQFGGYQAMPAGYRDAVLCIQRKGAVTGSPYASYAKRMMGIKE